MDKLICPVCKSDDYCKFVFVEHRLHGDNNVVELDNPSDDHFIYMCPNLHFFDITGQEIKHP